MEERNGAQTLVSKGDLGVAASYYRKVVSPLFQRAMKRLIPMTYDSLACAKFAVVGCLPRTSDDAEDPGPW